MNILIAIDSLKGSLSSAEAGKAAASGVLRALPEATVSVFPLADGGEGSADAILSTAGGERVSVTVKDPLGRPIEASYGLMNRQRTAVLEMAAAAGLPLLTEAERDPRITSTYGVGQLILDALGRGVRDFLIGIGGSATNDGGTGMLRALGFAFTDENGHPVPEGARGLGLIRHIQTEGAHPALADCRFSVACDVENPLCGERGASLVYGPQKGAEFACAAQMDRDMAQFEARTREVLPMADGTLPGSGAAGGLGFALRSYLGATLRSGIELMIEAVGLEEAIKKADLVITGEGRLDGQSAMGKAPVGVARAAKRFGKPVLALAGSVSGDARRTNSLGIHAFFPILKAPCSLSEAMDPNTTAENLADTAEQALRLILAFRS